MLTQVIIITIMLFLLIWSANHFIVGAAGIAQHFNIPPLFIGLTIVSIGTSSPEIIISVVASMQGKTDMAVGNAIGSNISNIGLILGLTALMSPLKEQSALLKREYPLLFAAMLLIYVLFLDNYLGRIDGLILLLCTIALLTYFAVLSSKKSNHDPYVKEVQLVLKQKQPLKSSLFSLVLGLAILPISAKFLVESSATVAKWLGVSDLVIGLTLIAIGTSLPELITSVLAALKEEYEIAIGNIIGSNIYNLILVLAFPGIFGPGKISPYIENRDIPVMFIITLILVLFVMGKKHTITRLHGLIFIGLYALYLIFLIKVYN